MKINALFLFAFFLILACTKDEPDQQPFVKSTESLVGEWQLIEQNISIGGPSSWEKVTDGDTFTLNADGSFKGFSTFIVDGNCSTGAYTSTEEELRLTYNCISYSEKFIYSCSTEDGDLILSPKTVICTESCATKYRKID